MVMHPCQHATLPRSFAGGCPQMLQQQNEEDVSAWRKLLRGMGVRELPVTKAVQIIREMYHQGPAAGASSSGRSAQHSGSSAQHTISLGHHLHHLTCMAAMMTSAGVQAADPQGGTLVLGFPVMVHPGCAGADSAGPASGSGAADVAAGTGSSSSSNNNTRSGGSGSTCMDARKLYLPHKGAYNLNQQDLIAGGMRFIHPEVR